MKRLYLALVMFSVIGLMGYSVVSAIVHIDIWIDRKGLSSDYVPREGEPKTLTYVGKDGKKKTVIDYRGKWDASGYSGANYIDLTDVVVITQDKDMVIGEKTFGSDEVGANMNTLNAVTLGDKLRCSIYSSSENWQGPWDVKISPDKDRFKCGIITFKRQK